MRRSHRPSCKSSKVPVSGISIFLREKKPDFEASHSDLTRLQVFNAMNEQWTNLDPNMKLLYERKADYLRRSEARKATAANTEDTLDSTRAKITSYSIFVRERHHSLKEEHPELSLSQRTAEITAEWGRMTPDQKRTFVINAKRETRKFRRISDEEETDGQQNHRQLT
jgi:hypothetical protein